MPDATMFQKNQIEALGYYVHIYVDAMCSIHLRIAVPLWIVSVRMVSYLLYIMQASSELG